MTITAQPRVIAAAAINRSTCTGTRHGNRSAYHNYGCRCDDAISDASRYRKLHAHGYLKPALVDATPAQRKIQAMYALGHDSGVISECSGLSVGQIHRLLTTTRRGKRKYVRKEHADAITATYILLADQEGHNEQLRSRAAGLGYHLPSAWDDIDDLDDIPEPLLAPEEVVDEVLVARALLGNRAAIAQLHDGAEKVDFFVKFLTRDGNTISDLAELLDCEKKDAIPDRQAFAEAYLLRPGNTVSGLMRVLECNGTTARQLAQKMIVSWLCQVAKERQEDGESWDDVAAYMIAVAGNYILWGNHSRTGQPTALPGRRRAERPRRVLADAA